MAQYTLKEHSNITERDYQHLNKRIDNVEDDVRQLERYREESDKRISNISEMLTDVAASFRAVAKELNQITVQNREIMVFINGTKNKFIKWLFVAFCVAILIIVALMSGKNWNEYLHMIF